MKILYAGTPAIAVPTLSALCEHFEVVGVLTAIDKPQGRKKVLTPSPVKEAALLLHLPLLQFDHLGLEARKAVSLLGADTLVCFAFGKFFGPKFLSLFDLALNVHPSLLPLHRGPSPIQSAILHGDEESGISIQKLAQEMDSGSLCAQMRFALDGTENTLTLTDKVSRLAPGLVVETLSHPLLFHSQEGKATYCRMISRDDGVIDWARSAKEISAQIRALYPWPKAQTTLGGDMLYLTSVSGFSEGGGSRPGTVLGKDKGRGISIQCGDGILWVDRVQKQQKNEMDALSFLNGNTALIGSVLGAGACPKE